MDKDDYLRKLNTILNDETKFEKLNEKEEDIINRAKKKVNDIILEVNR